jgi:hypothetical protein
MKATHDVHDLGINVKTTVTTDINILDLDLLLAINDIVHQLVKGVHHLDYVLNMHIIVHPLATDVIDIRIHCSDVINLRMTFFDTLRRPFMCLLRLADKRPFFVEIHTLVIVKDAVLNLPAKVPYLCLTNHCKLDSVPGQLFRVTLWKA